MSTVKKKKTQTEKTLCQRASESPRVYLVVASCMGKKKKDERNGGGRRLRGSWYCSVLRSPGEQHDVSDVVLELTMSIQEGHGPGTVEECLC